MKGSIRKWGDQKIFLGYTTKKITSQKCHFRKVILEFLMVLTYGSAGFR